MRDMDYSIFEFLSSGEKTEAKKNHIFLSISLVIIPDNDMFDGEKYL